MGIPRALKGFSPLQDAGVEPKDINEILLVGGMTRMPKVLPTELSRVVGKKTNTWMSRWKLGSIVRVIWLFHLHINGVYWGETTH